jgi:hypothetical protein
LDVGTVYYLPGTSGWSTNFAGLPTAPWYQSNPLIWCSGAGAPNGVFGFAISGASNLSLVVEACTNLAAPVWQPVQTNPPVNGTNYFTDANWTNFPVRFYRVRTP